MNHEFQAVPSFEALSPVPTWIDKADEDLTHIVTSVWEGETVGLKFQAPEDSPDIVAIGSQAYRLQRIRQAIGKITGVEPVVDSERFNRGPLLPGINYLGDPYGLAPAEIVVMNVHQGTSRVILAKNAHGSNRHLVLARELWSKGEYDPRLMSQPQGAEVRATETLIFPIGNARSIKQGPTGVWHEIVGIDSLDGEYSATRHVITPQFPDQR